MKFAKKDWTNGNKGLCHVCKQPILHNDHRACIEKAHQLADEERRRTNRERNRYYKWRKQGLVP